MVEHLQSPIFASREDSQTTNIGMMIKLNQSGIITTDSQEGIVKGDYKERAYLDAIVPPDVGRKLIEKMNKGEFRAWEIKRLSEEDMNTYYDTYESIPVTMNKGRPKTGTYAAFPNDVPDVSLYMGEDEPRVAFTISEPTMMVGFMDTVYGRHGSEEGGLFTTLLKTMGGRRKTRRRKHKQTRRRK